MSHRKIVKITMEEFIDQTISLFEPYVCIHFIEKLNLIKNSVDENQYSLKNKAKFFYLLDCFKQMIVGVYGHSELPINSYKSVMKKLQKTFPSLINDELVDVISNTPKKWVMGFITIFDKYDFDRDDHFHSKVGACLLRVREAKEFVDSMCTNCSSNGNYPVQRSLCNILKFQYKIWIHSVSNSYCEWYPNKSYEECVDKDPIIDTDRLYRLNPMSFIDQCENNLKNSQLVVIKYKY